ncbi:ubiquitin specific protease 25 [Ceratobasidium sp. AG-Ba]|nr:ubiquitin specific protease 25 [Ceratobasidium sp. AG-Ba]
MSSSTESNYSSGDELAEYIPVGKNHFATREQGWLVGYMDEFCQINGREAAGTSTAKRGSAKSKGRQKEQVAMIGQETDTAFKNKTDEFKAKLLVDFGRRFPWRLPQNRTNTKYPERLRNLSIPAAEWQQTGVRLYTRLQKLKPEEAKLKKKAASTFRSFGNSSTTAAAVQYPNAVYETAPNVLEAWQASLLYLGQQAQHSWAAVDPETLSSRWDHMAIHIHNIMNAISHTFGTETVMWGAYGSEGEIRGFELASDRAKHFRGMQPALDMRNSFSRFLINIMGPSLSTDLHSASPSIIAHPETLEQVFPPDELELLPTMRLLDLFLQTSWSYCGGHGSIPYALLEQDSKSQTYALTKLELYPKGETVIRDPFFMDADSVQNWQKHLIVQGTQDAAKVKPWRFYQPSPGVYESHIRHYPYDPDHYRLPPESLHYAHLQHARGESPLLPRHDGLPLVESHTKFTSLSQDQTEQMLRTFGPGSVFTDLTEKLRAFNHAFPPHMELSHFQSLRADMPFILSNRDPEPDETHELLVLVDQIYLPKSFFTEGKIQGQPCDLFEMLNWCDHRHWMNENQEVLLGGPYGVKWLVIVLLVLGNNERILNNPDISSPLFLGSPDCNISARERRAIMNVATSFCAALDASTHALLSSMEDRRVIKPDQRIYHFQQADEDLIARASWNYIATGQDQWTEQGIIPAHPTEGEGAEDSHPEEHTRQPGKRSHGDTTGQSPPKKTPKIGQGRRSKWSKGKPVAGGSFTRITRSSSMKPKPKAVKSGFAPRMSRGSHKRSKTAENDLEEELDDYETTDAEDEKAGGQELSDEDESGELTNAELDPRPSSRKSQKTKERAQNIPLDQDTEAADVPAAAPRRSERRAARADGAP